MLDSLPVIALILLWLTCKNFQEDWRSALLSAAVIWGVLVIAFTEILSVFQSLTFSTVLMAWSLTIIVLGFIYYQQTKRQKRSQVLYQENSQKISLIKSKIFNLEGLPRTTVLEPQKITVEKTQNFSIFSNLTPVAGVILSGVIFILAIVGLTAFIAPPNNWDSMTYHMPRVIHWIQNHSVAHYPTYDSAQLVHPPFAEFAILQFQILSNSDRLANWVQWLSMIGSTVGVSLIAKQLGADNRGQILAAVFCATIPMGILQASSTQNDFVVAFWLVCLAHYILSILPYKKPRVYLIIAIAASLGLAILTKSSGYLFAFPFMIVLFVWYVNRLKWGLWKPAVIVTTIFLLLNIGHYLRNIDLYGSPIATVDYTDDYKIEVYSLPTFISNIIRNLTLHVDIVRYFNLQEFITPITGKVEKLVSIIHGLLGVDMNDPRITFPANSYRVPGLSFDENTAGNPLHLFIVLISLIIFSCNRTLRKNKEVISYLFAVIGGFLMICLMLKLQPYQSRHHLSLFVLFSAFVGLVFSKILNRHLITVLAVILIITALPFAFENKFRPILAENNIFNTPRSELYFTNRTYLTNSYLGAINFIKTQNCNNIGLSLGGEANPSHLDWEYPFLALSQEINQKPVRFQHILHPDNTSSRFLKEKPYKDFSTCAIIATRSKNKPLPETMEVNNSTYISKWSSKPVSVLMKQ